MLNLQKKYVRFELYRRNESNFVGFNLCQIEAQCEAQPKPMGLNDLFTTTTVALSLILFNGGCDLRA